MARGKKLLLLNNLAVNLAGAAGGIGLVHIDMHGKRIFGMYTADNVVEDQSALIGDDLDLNDFLVFYAEIGAVLRSKVDVALCDDDAFGQLNLALGADKLAGAGTGQNTGFANGSGDTECTGVGRGNLDLGLLADRAEDRDILKGALGADDVDTLKAGVLTGLGEVLLVGELSTLAEQGLEIGGADMNVARAGLYQNFILHWNFLLQNFYLVLYRLCDRLVNENETNRKIFRLKCAILSLNRQNGKETVMSRTLEELRESLADCRGCRLCEERKNVVFGAGAADARVMLIGEGPGQHEDEQGEPFVGRAGILLDKMLDAVGLSRQRNVFIANMVKCRPPKNRDPQPDETEACLPFLREQVRLISPRVIVCLGRIAAQRLISPDFRVTRQHGEFFDKNGTLMMGTLHPAALLRNPAQKPAAFEDWLRLREKLMEICPEVYESREKQDEK